MKKLLLLLSAILFISCSNDDNKLSNEPKDWLKALNIINLFTIVFCVFINKTDFIIPLFVIFTFAGFAGFIIFGLINKIIVKQDKAKVKNKL